MWILAKLLTYTVYTCQANDTFTFVHRMDHMFKPGHLVHLSRSPLTYCLNLLHGGYYE